MSALALISALALLGPQFDELRLADHGVRALAHGDYETALAILTKAERAYTTGPGGLDVCLFTARAYLEMGREMHFRFQLLNCRARFWRDTPTRYKHPPEVLRAFNRVVLINPWAKR